MTLAQALTYCAFTCSQSNCQPHGSIIYINVAGDDRAQFFTLRAAKALAMTALDVLLRPELLQRVKQEFTEATLKESTQSVDAGREAAADHQAPRNSADH